MDDHSNCLLQYLLVKWQEPAFQSAWAAAAAKLCEGMRAKSAAQFVIVGGSSDTWRYDKWMSQEQRSLNDANAKQLAGVFTVCGV